MADKILKELTLKIWRQKDAKSKGEFKTYKVHNISTGTSFLEMLDILNEQLVEQNEEPVHSIMTVVKVFAVLVVCSSTAVLTDRTMM